MANTDAPSADDTPDTERQDAGAEPAPDAKAAAPARPSAFRRPAVRIALAVLLLLVLIAGGVWLFRYLTTGRYQESTDDAYIQADSVAVAPKVSGYVEEVLVANNQDVQQGQPLVRIDPRDYLATAAQSQAQIDVANANADAVRAQIGEQRSAITEARSQLQY